MIAEDLVGVLVGFLRPATAIRLSHTCRKYRCLVTEHPCWTITKHNVGLSSRRSMRRWSPFRAVVKHACSCCRAAKRQQNSPLCATCQRKSFPALDKCMTELASTNQVLCRSWKRNDGLIERRGRLEATRERLLADPLEASRGWSSGRDLTFFQTCPAGLMRNVRTPQVRVRVWHIP